jgi:hypothetical protein
VVPILVLDNLIEQQQYDYILSCINRFWKFKKTLMDYESQIYHRYSIHNPSFLIKIHEQLTTVAEDKFQTKLKKSYCFLSMYLKGEGICPLHTDRPQCKYSIDLCLDQLEPWSIFVNDLEFMLKPNQALLYSGTDHPHYRNKIQPHNYATLAFFHFVDFDFEGDLR